MKVRFSTLKKSPIFPMYQSTGMSLLIVTMLMPNAKSPPETTGGKLAGKYLTFVLGHESYGVPVLKVREIIRLATLTEMPQMPAHVKGVINLRGKIIPVVDLGVKFGLPSTASDGICIIVVQIAGPACASILLGLIVDGVEEVSNFGAEDIEETPDFGAAVNTAYILGMAKAKGAVKTLLDLDRILATA